MRWLCRKHTCVCGILHSQLINGTPRSPKGSAVLIVCVCVFSPPQDFVHHFHVLLPSGLNAGQAGIKEFLQGVQLDPDGYQVGKTMVLLKFFFFLLNYLAVYSLKW